VAAKDSADARRAPRQERAHRTVDAILEAARILVVRHGLEALTTNGVARLAGVSIGSLYQYFPSKRALISALRERHQQAGEQLFIATLAELYKVHSVDVAVRCFVESMVLFHRHEPALHRALELAGRRDTFNAREQRMFGLIRGYLESRRELLAVTDMDQATLVIASAVEAITHNAAILQPAALADDKLIDDVTRMLTFYLTRRIPE
jgi:AcrR family transcriptional regulator